jgi:hypothetical protein
MQRSIERSRLSLLRPGDRQTEYHSGGVAGNRLRASMLANGMMRVACETTDSAGRRKFSEVTMGVDAVLRLHHSIGEALKARGLFAPLETDEERYVRIASENAGLTAPVNVKPLDEASMDGEADLADDARRYDQEPTR